MASSIHQRASPGTSDTSNGTPGRGRKGDIRNAAPEPTVMENEEYFDWAMSQLESKGYDVVYKGHHSAPPWVRVKGLIWFNVFVGTWIASCLYPVLLILSFFLPGMWPIGIVLATLWFICRVVFKDYVESDAWRRTKLAQFMQRRLSKVGYYSACSISHYKMKEEGNRPPTMLAFHPHGIFSLGWSLVVCTQPRCLKGFRCLFADTLYATPFFFAWCNMFQKFGGVKGPYMKQLMSNGESIALIPGGFEEATLHYSQKDRLYLKERKGFVAFAMRYGYELRPVFTFGERKSYKNAQGFMGFRLWLNTLPLKLPAVLPLGRSLLFPLFPRKDAYIHTVIGPAVKFDKQPDVSHAEVDAAHEAYMARLQAFYAELGPILDPSLEGEYKIELY